MQINDSKYNILNTATNFITATVTAIQIILDLKVSGFTAHRAAIAVDAISNCPVKFNNLTFSQILSDLHIW